MQQYLLPTTQCILSTVGASISVAVSLSLALSGWGPWIISLCAVAGIFPSIFIAPLLSPLLDIPKLIRLISILLLTEFIILFFAALNPSPPILLAMVFLIGITSCLIHPALMTLARGAEKTTAKNFSRMDTARTIGMLIGPLVGGLIHDVFSLTTSLLIAAMTLVTIAATVRKIHPIEIPRSIAPTQNWLARIAEAPNFIFRKSIVRRSVFVLALAVTFTSIYSVSNVLLATRVLGLSGLGYAILVQAFVIGRLLGSQLGAYIQTAKASTWLIGANFLMGLGLCVAGLIPNAFIVAIGFTAAGIANALQIAALRMIFIGHLPAAVIPKALSSLGSINSAAMVIGLVAATPLIDLCGPAGAIFIAGLGTLCIAVISLFFNKWTSPLASTNNPKNSR